MAKVFLITSGKGGVGKSTVACNLAVSLADAGKKCVLIDMDMGLRSLDIMLGIENRIVYDVSDVADGLCRVRQALVKRDEERELYLMPASQLRDGMAVSGKALEACVNKLREKYDIILIDSPAGIGSGFKNALYTADGAITVATCDAVALRDAERVCSMVDMAGVRVEGLILNRVTHPMLLKSWQASPSVFAENCDTDILGIIPEDSQIPFLATRGMTAVEKHTKSAQAFRDAALRLTGEQIPLAITEEENLLDKMRALFKSNPER